MATLIVKPSMATGIRPSDGVATWNAWFQSHVQPALQNPGPCHPQGGSGLNPQQQPVATSVESSIQGVNQKIGSICRSPRLQVEFKKLINFKKKELEDRTLFCFTNFGTVLY